MTTVSLIKLGSKVKDLATDMTGVLTHAYFGYDGRLRLYNFQPQGLNKETKLPMKSLWLHPSRIKSTAAQWEERALPTEVIGTKVKDASSGFEGMATALSLHINGCVHVEIQSADVNPKTGELVEPYELDIRRLTGKAVPVLEAEEKRRDEDSRPSPAGAAAPSHHHK